LNALQQDLSLSDTKLAGASIPESRRREIALDRAQLGPHEKIWIVGFPQP